MIRDSALSLWRPYSEEWHIALHATWMLVSLPGVILSAYVFPKAVDSISTAFGNTVLSPRPSSLYTACIQAAGPRAVYPYIPVWAIGCT